MFAAERMLAQENGEVDFAQMKVKHLQAELAEREVSKTGRKAMLQHRLHALLVQAAARAQVAEEEEDVMFGEEGAGGEAGEEGHGEAGE